MKDTTSNQNDTNDEKSVYHSINERPINTIIEKFGVQTRESGYFAPFDNSSFLNFDAKNIIPNPARESFTSWKFTTEDINNITKLRRNTTTVLESLPRNLLNLSNFDDLYPNKSAGYIDARIPNTSFLDESLIDEIQSLFNEETRSNNNQEVSQNPQNSLNNSLNITSNNTNNIKNFTNNNEEIIMKSNDTNAIEQRESLEIVGKPKELSALLASTGQIHTNHMNNIYNNFSTAFLSYSTELESLRGIVAEIGKECNASKSAISELTQQFNSIINNLDQQKQNLESVKTFNIENLDKIKDEYKNQATIFKDAADVLKNFKNDTEKEFNEYYNKVKNSCNNLADLAKDEDKIFASQIADLEKVREEYNKTLDDINTLLDSALQKEQKATRAGKHTEEQIKAINKAINNLSKPYNEISKSTLEKLWEDIKELCQKFIDRTKEVFKGIEESIDKFFEKCEKMGNELKTSIQNMMETKQQTHENSIASNTSNNLSDLNLSKSMAQSQRINSNSNIEYLEKLNKSSLSAHNKSADDIKLKRSSTFSYAEKITAEKHQPQTSRVK